MSWSCGGEPCGSGPEPSPAHGSTGPDIGRNGRPVLYAARPMTQGDARHGVGAGRSGWKWRLAALLLLAIATLSTYGGTLGHEFVWDDHEQIVDNPHLRSWSSFPRLWQEDFLTLSRPGQGRSNYYRPLVFAQYQLYYQAFELNGVAWHGLALLHHLVASIAVLLFVRTLGFGRATSLVAAVLFVVHPVHTESVSWVAAAYNDPPVATFLLLALTAHVRWMSSRRPVWLMLAVLGFGIALCLKESALSFLLLVPLVELFVRLRRPATSGGEVGSRSPWLGVLAVVPFWLMLGLFLAVEVGSGWTFLSTHPHVSFTLEVVLAVGALIGLYAWLGRRGRIEDWRGRLAGYLPYVVLAITYFYVRKVMIHTLLGVFPDAMPLGEFLKSVPWLAVYYVRLAVWPFGLSPSYPLRYLDSWLDPLAWGSIALLALGGLALVRLGRRYPVVLFGALWFGLCLLPALNTRSFRPTYLVHHRYLYLAVFGLCLIVAWALTRWIGDWRARYGLATALVLVWGGSSVYHNRYWATDEVLWRRISQVDPANPAGFDWLGSKALEAGRLDEAESHFRSSIEADSRAPQGHRNLAVLTHVHRGRPREALPLYERALESYGPLLPLRFAEYLDCRLNYAGALAEVGRADAALSIFLEAAAAPAYSARAARNAAVLLMRAGRVAEVESVLRAAAARHPQDGELRRMLAEVQRLRASRSEGGV